MQNTLKTLFLISICTLMDGRIWARSLYDEKPELTVIRPNEEPYKRPIGFSYNFGALSSLTIEGRFLLGLIPNLSLIISPSYQSTLELPWYHLQRKYVSIFSIRRAHLGAGVRFHFYDFDSRAGWYIEPLGRAGFTFVGDDEKVISLIPSLILGYTTVYDIGFMASFGIGLEYEFLLGKKNYYTEHLATAYYGFTKVPLTGEFSLGWMF